VTDTVMYVSTVVTAGASVGSMLAVAWSLRSLSRQVRAATKQAEVGAEATKAASYLALAQMFVHMDEFFADRPDLRARIYGSHQGEESGEDLERHRTEAAAEMTIDVVDAGISNLTQLSDSAIMPVWEAWFRHFTRSPAVREFWESHREWYGPETVDFIDRAMRMATPEPATGVAVETTERAAN